MDSSSLGLGLVKLIVLLKFSKGKLIKTRSSGA
jgi:hypothetical protein